MGNLKTFNTADIYQYYLIDEPLYPQHDFYSRSSLSQVKGTDVDRLEEEYMD